MSAALSVYVFIWDAVAITRERREIVRRVLYSCLGMRVVERRR